MKYLFHTVTLGQTGGARVILNLSKILVDRGHDVTIIIDRNKVDYDIPAGVSVKYLSFFGLRSVQGFKVGGTSSQTGMTLSSVEKALKPKVRLLSLAFKWFKYFLKLLFIYPFKFVLIRFFLRKYKPDLVASHNMYQDLEHLFFYRREANFFLVIHNSPKEVYLNRRHLKIFPLNTYLNGINVLCVSHESEMEYKELFGRVAGVVKTIYNPLNFENIRLMANESLSAHYKNMSYLLVVASLGERKRVDRVITLLSGLEADNNLIILGDGPLMPELEEFAASLGLEDRVHFLGFDSNPYKYMKNAKTLVLSADSEGLGMVLVESIVSGVIPVSLDCPVGPREVLVGELAQFLVPSRGEREEVIQAGLSKAVGVAMRSELCEFSYEDDLLRFEEGSIAQHWEKLARGQGLE